MGRERGKVLSLQDLIARARRDVDEGVLPSCQLAVARDGELAGRQHAFVDVAPGARDQILQAQDLSSLAAHV